jgi:hypothetical protein
VPGKFPGHRQLFDIGDAIDPDSLLAEHSRSNEAKQTGCGTRGYNDVGPMLEHQAESAEEALYYHGNRIPIAIR